MGHWKRRTIMTAWLVALALMGACRDGGDDGSDMPQQDIKSVMEAHVDALMALDGVTAVAIGALDDGTPCIKVYVVERTDELDARIPKSLEGHPVVVEVSGIIEPLSGDDG